MLRCPHSGRSASPIVIREQHHDIHAAVAIAADRAGRSMTRQLQLHLHADREPLRQKEEIVK